MARHCKQPTLFPDSGIPPEMTVYRCPQCGWEAEEREWAGLDPDEEPGAICRCGARVILNEETRRHGCSPSTKPSTATGGTPAAP